jgi:hypothetical protein
LKKIKLFDYRGHHHQLRPVEGQPAVVAGESLAARTTLFNKLNVNFNSLWDPYAVNAGATHRPKRALRDRQAGAHDLHQRGRRAST